MCTFVLLFLKGRKLFTENTGQLHSRLPFGIGSGPRWFRITEQYLKVAETLASGKQALAADRARSVCATPSVLLRFYAPKVASMIRSTPLGGLTPVIPCRGVTPVDVLTMAGLELAAEPIRVNWQAG
ncbi:hypothetical protein LTR35_018391, partial [Friedmanniomyces endolithicus]